MGQINKGRIANISGNTARVVPCDSSVKPTVTVTIPAHLRGTSGNLEKGTEVIYVEFSDYTGMLLSRSDGEGESGGGGDSGGDGDGCDCTGTSIVLDTTMTQEGQAAEAKAAGDRFKIIEGKLSDLLYEIIKITSFKNNVQTAKIGQTVTAVTFTWAFSKAPESVTLAGEDQPVDSTGATIPVNVTNNTSWTLRATDERDGVATASCGITFLHGVYYGVGAARTAYDSEFVNGLAVDWRTNKKPSVTLSPNGEHVYYCLPTWMGECSFAVGVLPGGFELADTISFKNEYGHTQNYYIYKSVEALTGSSIKINIT